MIDNRVSIILGAGLPDRATDRYQLAVKYAVDTADGLNSQTIDAIHLLSGLIREGQGIAYNVLANLDFKFDNLTKLLSAVPRSEANPKDKVSEDAMEAVRKSVDWMRRFGHSYLGTEHLLLGLTDNGRLASTFTACGVQSEDIRYEIHGLLGLFS